MPLMTIALAPKGVASNVARHMLPEGFVPVSDNMQLFKGQLELAPGYVDFAPDVLVGNQIMHLDEFPMEAGSVRLLAFTDRKAYAFDPATDTFVNITRQSGGVDVDFTGGMDDAFQADTVVNPAGDLFYVATNNKRDPVVKWDGVLANRMTTLGGSPTDGGLHFSRSVATYMNHLFHLNRVEAGVNKPRMLRWSDNGQPEVYTGGTSSFLTLFQGADHGVALAPLGNFLAVYRERSIHLVNFVGAPFFFAQRQVVNGIGLVSPRALLNLDTRHIFLGNDNVYVFNGVDLEPVGEPIREQLFDTMDPDNAERSLIVLDEMRYTMALIVPSAGSQFPDTWWFWNLTTGAWSGPVKGRKCSAVSEFERRESSTWDGSAGVPWDSDSGIWDSASNVVGFPTVLFGNDARVVHQVDATTVFERGVAKTGRVESPAVMPGARVFDPPQQEVVCTWLQPLASSEPANWYVGISDRPTGPFTFTGPFTVGPRGFVMVKPTRGKWFTFAVEGTSAFKVTGVIANFEPAGAQ